MLYFKRLEKQWCVLYLCERFANKQLLHSFILFRVNPPTHIPYYHDIN